MFETNVETQSKLISLLLIKENKKLRLEDEVRRNILNLLNTRCSLTLEDFLSMHADDFDFRYCGLPEINLLNFEGSAGVQILCDVIKTSVLIFEPRITNFEVHFTKYDALKKNVYLNMRGNLIGTLSNINIVLKLGVWEFSVV